ncbi:MAG: hypothetical protein U1E17_13340 [Geminicoccaceae bacterium]
MIRLSHAAFAAALLATGPVLAASDGTLGATSTGSSNISLTVAAAVKVSNVSDITLNASSLTGSTLEGTDLICIYSSVGSSHRYKITLSTPTASYKLTNVSDNSLTIPYQVNFRDNDGSGVGSANWYGATQGVAVLNGTQFGGSGSQNCNGGNNASYKVIFQNTDLASASSGTYDGTLNLLVEAGTP